MLASTYFVPFIFKRDCHFLPPRFVSGLKLLETCGVPMVQCRVHHCCIILFHSPWFFLPLQFKFFHSWVSFPCKSATFLGFLGKMGEFGFGVSDSWRYCVICRCLFFCGKELKIREGIWVARGVEIWMVRFQIWHILLAKGFIVLMVQYYPDTLPILFSFTLQSAFEIRGANCNHKSTTKQFNHSFKFNGKRKWTSKVIWTW